jgi:hypothetical protein
VGYDSKHLLHFIKGVRDKFYMSHIKIEMKNLKSYRSLVDAETYFIRINLTSLNEQILHKTFLYFEVGVKI